MMNRIPFLAVFVQVVVLLLTSCGKNGSTSLGEDPVDDIAIGFSSSVTSLPEVRGNGTGVITALSDMHVFASYTSSTNWQTTNPPNFMYDQLMTKNTSSGIWTYTPVKYWPNTAGDKISFFAYAPANLTGVTLSDKTFAGLKVIYTVPTNENDSQDLLLASAMNKTKSDGTVSFRMQHTLSQIKFCVKNGDTGTTKVLKGLTVKAPQTGIASFAIDGNFAWKIDVTNTGNLSSFIADNIFQSGTTVAIPSGLNGKTDVIAAFFLLPVGDASSFTVSLTYTLQKAGESSATELTATSYFPISPQWLPGSHIIYTLTLIEDRLEIGGITVEDYGNGTPAGNEIPAT